jgi:integrase
MKPDRDALRRLQPGQRLSVAGIEIECRPNGDLRFRLACRINGTRLHRTLGLQSHGMTLARARAAAETLRAAAREDRLQLPRGRKIPLTFAMAAERYIALLHESQGRNIERKARQLTRHLVPFLGGLRLDSLDAFTLQRYRKAQRDRGLTDAAVNRHLATISHLCGVAVAQGWIVRSPCRVPMVRETRKPRVLLSDAELARLLDAAADDSNVYLWLFVYVAASTGMRHAEILRARFDQVDFAGCRLAIPTAKAGERLQPLTPELAAVLRDERTRAIDPQGFIFPTRYHGRTIGHMTAMNVAFRRAVEACGLDPKRVTPHLLRHGAITRLLRAGVDLRTCQAISGHRTVTMLMHYAHTARPEVDRAMEALRLPAPNVTQTSPGAARVPARPPRVPLKVLK